MKLSVIIPVYNEAPTVRTIIERVRAAQIVGVEQHIVAVDDASTDGSGDVLDELAGDDLTVIRHPINRGKTAALRTALDQRIGDVVVIQDADLEYDPADYPRLLEPILADRADVVFGTRLADGNHRGPYPWRSGGNRVLTWLSNRLSGLRISDVACGYKAFRREVIQKIDLHEEGFGFDPEFTAKVARLGCRIEQVPVRYAARTYGQGKKIGWKDGLRAVWCIVKYNVWRS